MTFYLQEFLLTFYSQEDLSCLKDVNFDLRNLPAMLL